MAKRVLFVCGREPGYIRNRMIIKALGNDGSGTMPERGARLFMRFDPAHAMILPDQSKQA